MKKVSLIIIFIMISTMITTKSNCEVIEYKGFKIYINELPMNIDGIIIEKELKGQEKKKYLKILKKQIDYYSKETLSKYLSHIFLTKKLSIGYKHNKYSAYGSYELYVISNHNTDKKIVMDENTELKYMNIIFLDSREVKDTFHHEVSSLFYKINNNSYKTDLKGNKDSCFSGIKKEWLKINKIVYDTSNIVGGNYEKLKKEGFWSAEGKTNFEDDFNTIVGAMTTENIWDCIKKEEYKISKKKVQSVLKYYKKIDPRYTKEWFLKINNNQ